MFVPLLRVSTPCSDAQDREPRRMARLTHLASEQLKVLISVEAIALTQNFIVLCPSILF